MKGKVVYLGERFFDAIVVPLRGRKTTKRNRVSRDSAGNFVNFNLYPCPRALFIRLSATRALLTRQTKKQVISTRLGYDMHIRNVDRGYIALLVVERAWIYLSNYLNNQISLDRDFLYVNVCFKINSPKVFYKCNNIWYKKDFVSQFLYMVVFALYL